MFVRALTSREKIRLDELHRTLITFRCKIHFVGRFEHRRAVSTSGKMPGGQPAGRPSLHSVPE
jgi:hypothetical protein